MIICLHDNPKLDTDRLSIQVHAGDKARLSSIGGYTPCLVTGDVSVIDRQTPGEMMMRRWLVPLFQVVVLSASYQATIAQ